MFRKILIVLVLGLCASTVMAADAELRVDAVSAYVWRGIVLNDEPVLQPGLAVSASNGLSFSAWGSVNLTDDQEDIGINGHEFNETDLIAAYALPFEVVQLEVGVIEYLYPGVIDAEGTREAYATISTDKLPLNPRLTAYYDFDEADGWYGVASISDSRNLTDSLSLDVVVAVGAADSAYNEYYFEISEDKLNDANIMVTLTQQVIDSLSVGIYGGYSRLLSDQIQDQAEELYSNKDDNFFGGATVTYVF